MPRSSSLSSGITKKRSGKDPEDLKVLAQEGYANEM
jgi:hypothetical protein